MRARKSVCMCVYECTNACVNGCVRACACVYTKNVFVRVRVCFPACVCLLLGVCCFPLCECVLVSFISALGLEYTRLGRL